MALYTVELQNKHLITLYDAKGKKIGSKEEVVKQTICDLPWSTVAMYKEKTQGNLIVRDQVEEAPRRSIGRDPVGRSQRTGKGPTKISDYKPSASPAQSSTQKAAISGDMAAAINAKG